MLQIELMEDILKEKHIVLNKIFTIALLKNGMKIDINEFLRGIFIMKATIKNIHQFFDDLMEYIYNI